MMHVRGCDCGECLPPYPQEPTAVTHDERMSKTGEEFAFLRVWKRNIENAAKPGDP